MDHYFKNENLTGENQYSCSKCDAKTDATKKNYLDLYPNVLTVVLKRFKYGGNGPDKITYPVQYENTYDFSKYGAQNTHPAIYELYAVSNHHGQMLRSGHYTTDLKMSDGNW